MYRYIAWRFALILPTVVAASLLVFFVMRALPGDVALLILSGHGEGAVSPEAREALELELGLNDPLPVQYGRWAWSMLNGELGGRSLVTGESIRNIVARQLPVTLLLTAYTALLSIALSVPLGILAALWRNRWPDYVIRAMTLGGLAVPGLWLALLVLLAMLLFFRWSPPIIYTAPWSDPRNHLQMMLWPALILAWEYSSHIARVTRASVLESLNQNYVTTARAKGLSERDVVFRHAARTALVPAVTMLGLQFGALLSGALILETIFGLPGIGRGIVQAAMDRDYPVIQSLATLLVLLALMVNLLVDAVYKVVDPRVTYA